MSRSRATNGTRTVQGTTVGITSGRKADQLAAALERRGARVVVGPTVGGDVAEPDDTLAAVTDRIVAAQPDWLVANTGMGMKLWIEAAERTGRLDALRALARRTRCVARGAKAVAGLRRLDVAPRWVPDGETDAEVVARLREEVEFGQTVAVQLHGSDTQHPYGELPDRVELVTILPYRSALPDDVGPAQRLLDAIVEREVDVVAFTSPGAARGLLAIAEQDGADRAREVRSALAGDVAIASIGHVTSSALRQLGLEPAFEPERHRTGSLIAALDAWATERAGS